MRNDMEQLSCQEVVELARKSPGKLNHATGGPASLLALELFKTMAAVDITSVQYRGAAPSVAAVIAGEVDLCITDIASVNHVVPANSAMNGKRSVRRLTSPVSSMLRDAIRIESGG